jgi:quinol-cytochrome oxidoreductase complex cytochrome b subunit
MALHHKSPYKGWVGWLDTRLPIVYAIDKVVGSKHPTPRNLNYFWNFGSLAGLCLVIQILSGLFLAMHYNASTADAFNSVEHIMRDVNYGWLIRYMHAVGASMFFIVVFVHIFRGLYYGSYKAPREVLWWMGVLILLLMMATAFRGYVLPWGQMSFWGATVITNLFSAFPLVGESIVTWLWGGFSVDNPTLNRFFALHFLMPFVIVGVVMLHILALNAFGSNNPTGIDVKGDQDVIPVHPYYSIKDFFGIGVFLLVFAGFLFFAPNYLGHADNYIEANPLVTPAHIVPEWYFLPFYAILRAVTFPIPLWLLGAGAIGLAMALQFSKMVKPKCCPFAFFGINVSKAGMGLLSALIAIGGVLIVAGLGGAEISSKLGGVLAMFASILVLLFIPWLDSSPVRSLRYRPMMKIFFWLFAISCVALGWLGAAPAEGIYVILSQFFMAIYFGYFLVAMPVVSRIEKTLPLPNSIAESVLPAKGAHA